MPPACRTWSRSSLELTPPEKGALPARVQAAGLGKGSGFYGGECLGGFIHSGNGGFHRRRRAHSAHPLFVRTARAALRGLQCKQSIAPSRLALRLPACSAFGWWARAGGQSGGMAARCALSLKGHSNVSDPSRFIHRSLLRLLPSRHHWGFGQRVCFDRALYMRSGYLFRQSTRDGHWRADRGRGSRTRRKEEGRRRRRSDGVGRPPRGRSRPERGRKGGVEPEAGGPAAMGLPPPLPPGERQACCQQCMQ